MAARCPTCGEEALTETARFCVGCGGAIPEQAPHVVVEMLAADPVEPIVELHLPDRVEPPSPPPPAPQVSQPQAPVRDDTPRFEPTPAPPRGAAPTVPPPHATRNRPPPRLAPLPIRDTSPIVPLPLVLAGVLGLLVLLVILLIAA